MIRGMDPLADLLDGPRARAAFVLRSGFDPPWSVRIEDGAPLAVIAAVRGTAWLGADNGDSARLGPGDVAVVRGPDPYRLADGPHTEPQAVIGPGQTCRAPDGAELAIMGALGVRAWGNALDGETLLVIGVYEQRSEVAAHLLRALPHLLVMPGAAGVLVDVLAHEAQRDAPGQDAVLDRLLDVVLISVLREWFTRPDSPTPGWLRAHGDPVVGPVLAALHGEAAAPWTLESLARRAGVSRAALARRFHDQVGEPPMTYLTRWRLARAADLLSASDVTLAAVAREVGYGSAFALSVAFKRVRGVSPREHRLATSVP